jgi:hypothetical protein
MAMPLDFNLGHWPYLKFDLWPIALKLRIAAFFMCSLLLPSLLVYLVRQMFKCNE